MIEKRSTVIRLPADVARVVLFHPEFHNLGCASALRGHWVTRDEGRSQTYEIYNPPLADMMEFVGFANKVAGHLLERKGL